MNKGLALGALVAVALLARAEETPADAKKELKALTGSWKAVSVVSDGTEMSKEEVGKITLTVKGAKYTLKTPDGQEIEGSHKLDPSKKPKELDLIRDVDKDQKTLGIYELTKDTYKVCLGRPGKDRPKAFESKDGSGHRLVVFKRVKE